MTTAIAIATTAAAAATATIWTPLMKFFVAYCVAAVATICSIDPD